MHLFFCLYRIVLCVYAYILLTIIDTLSLIQRPSVKDKPPIKITNNLISKLNKGEK
jgi:hypothetical protein